MTRWSALLRAFLFPCSCWLCHESMITEHQVVLWGFVVWDGWT